MKASRFLDVLSPAVLLVLLISFAPYLIGAERLNCDLGSQPLVRIVFNESGTFVETTTQRRLSGSLSSSDEVLHQKIKLGAHPTKNLYLLRAEVHFNQPYLARACWCARELEREADYCFADYQICGVESDGLQMCFNNVRGLNFVRGAAPAMLFYLCCLLYVFLGSEQGSGARAYVYRMIISKCGWDGELEEQALDEYVTRLQERNPERASFLFRGALRRHRIMRRSQFLTAQRQQRREVRRRQRRFGETGEDSEQDVPADATGANLGLAQQPRSQDPEQLALKTKTYESLEGEHFIASSADNLPGQSKQKWKESLLNQIKKPSAAADEEIEGEMQHGLRCAICLSLLQNGERVGDLKCEHVFHVHCLKAWLKQKNQCPLCNQEEVAEPQYCPCNDEEVAAHAALRTFDHPAE